MQYVKPGGTSNNSHVKADLRHMCISKPVVTDSFLASNLRAEISLLA